MFFDPFLGTMQEATFTVENFGRKKKQPKNKQQTTNNKEQTTKNKEQRTKNKEQRTKNKQQTTKNKEQRTKNKEQRTKNKEQRTKNKEQRTKNKEQRTKNKEQRTKNKQQTTSNKQQTTNNKQQTTNNKQQTTNNKQQTTNNKQPQLVRPPGGGGGEPGQRVRLAHLALAGKAIGREEVLCCKSGFYIVACSVFFPFFLGTMQEATFTVENFGSKRKKQPNNKYGARETPKAERFPSSRIAGFRV